MKMSFYDWCIQNHRQDLLDRWYYDLNTERPEEVGKTAPREFYFKCPRGIHVSTPYKLNNVTKYSYSTVKCSLCNSFAQWGMDTVGSDFLDKYWDYDKNAVNPWMIPFRARKTTSIYIKCQNDIEHGSYLTFPDHFVSGSRCPYCSHSAVLPKDSFGQWGIDNIDPNFLNKYWDYDKNMINPMELSKKSNQPIYIKCQDKDYHGSYKVIPYDFVDKNIRCPFCHMVQVHLFDSLGTNHPEVFDVWSDKNTDTPYDVSPGSGRERWFKCHTGKHQDYLSRVSRVKSRNFECPKCHSDQDKSYLHQKVESYLTNHPYHINTEYDCTLATINPLTGYILPYDIELVINDNLSLYIEVMGKQHYEVCLLTKEDAKERGCTPEESLQLLQYRDKIKRENVLQHNQAYLEIPYWTESNESYKTLIDDKIHKILSLTIQND